MRARALLSVVLASAFACGGSTHDPSPSPAPGPPQAEPAVVAAPSRDSQIEQLADHLMARASAHERSVSALLQKVAADLGGQLAGFEHRLKRRDSLVRKIKKTLHEHPEKQPSDIVIDDALRYTVEIADVPPGRHVETIRTAFVRLQGAGHKVHQVKNYWPRGDNYSGVNSVLETADGLRWELQFHTPESFRVQKRDHDLYEQYREVSTPAARKRELYFQMSRPWESVAIPTGMLDAKSLGREQEIIKRAPPPGP